MTDSRRDESDPTQQLPYEYPGYADPAYANQASYGPSYQAPPTPDQTQQLPPYSPHTYQPPPTEQFGAQYPPAGQPPEPPEPEGPPTRLWLWALAALSVVIVIGLVIALVVVNTSQQETVVAPPTSPPEPSFTTAPPTTTLTPSAPRLPLPFPIPGPTPPGGSATPGETETVVYNVTGTGRAINITYIDSGGMFQTEFNVMLPWSKQVELSAPAEQSASVSIINVGREIGCSISINGVPLQERSGSGLTICSPVS
ncbi:MmpS family transport accessory protein [Mycolicibacterium sp. YH-1]|uniref:MmpS family transport accessory protein n=1 Tax=Mycolicibacterium sp. YH-1 TaxID=2908837 RepID=UPI001F4BE95E|nr:MmpS family transport accessory protein [Mycolicibacterium sp. YH-1]UNB54790.1 MmpS family protein [Mycolicibacterium sp. YH-1]